MIEKNYYTVKEIADELRVHPNTVYRSIKSGRISAVKVGGGRFPSFRIPRDELQRLAMIGMRVTII